MSPLLQVRDLHVQFRQDGAVTHAVKGVSFDLNKGETVALVGESGSGKSVTALSTVSLLPDSAEISGSVTYDGAEMVGASEKELRRVRGNDISFIFQEPMTSLNPLHSIEKQLAESLLIHQGMTGQDARARILELLHEVGIVEPERRLASYPHQLSGGQRQRVMIAMALANNPELLIADEPTTALDVTIQAQILDLLERIQRERGMSMLFITHDLGIVRKFADRVNVMKSGEIVEHGNTAEIFDNPQHPYTRPFETYCRSHQGGERGNDFGARRRNNWDCWRKRVRQNHACTGDHAVDFVGRASGISGPEHSGPEVKAIAPPAV